MDKLGLKENRVHGSVMFPLGTYTMICQRGDKILDCHWHDEWEFLMVTAGQALFQIETSYYEVHAGQAIFVDGSSIHAGYSHNNSPCIYRAVVFDPVILSSNSCDNLQIKFIDPFIKRHYVLPNFIAGRSDWERRIIHHLSSILNVCATIPLGYELTVKARLLLILSEFVKNNHGMQADDSLVNNYKSEQMKKVLNYIHTNYSRKIVIKSLCEQISMSEGHFCRLFKKMMRQTPIEYINAYRINTAAQLLKETNHNVLEISMSVGFDNLSYFDSLFKKRMRCTPLEYRNTKQVLRQKLN
ncbi:AraC-like DNA-binding protein [Sporomusaceae bacterium BoRhaA]|uniref:AraC family transcriptional regulator n=1 Tax=Pelorhabdus rhamnosifermentans TaxID=2772457 RepID=UPI001C05FDE2|nr:AraC family transcriptional regulator [Pelorhabdus rhamnosifermentans]MBU2699107.1 AraC-like DNA-binding protein [Pelorhabdus rhamnosifermentans]